MQLEFATRKKAKIKMTL